MYVYIIPCDVFLARIWGHREEGDVSRGGLSLVQAHGKLPSPGITQRSEIEVLRNEGANRVVCSANNHAVDLNLFMHTYIHTLPYIHKLKVLNAER